MDNTTTGQVDISAAVDALITDDPPHRHAYQVNVPALCPTCEGGGVIGDERKHRSCPDCNGTGNADGVAH